MVLDHLRFCDRGYAPTTLRSLACSTRGSTAPRSSRSCSRSSSAPSRSATARGRPHDARARRVQRRARAQADLDELGRAYPARRAGRRGDEALAARARGRLPRAWAPTRSARRRFEAETADGERRLTTVVARQAGPPGAGLVVVAHRDALGARRARRALGHRGDARARARRRAAGACGARITFVSTSGGSGGAAGARDLAERLAGPTDAVLVLGDLGGQRPCAGRSSPAGRTARRRRRCTCGAPSRRRSRAEAGTDPGAPRATTQWARLAFPFTRRRAGPARAPRACPPRCCRSAASAARPPAPTVVARARCRPSAARRCARSPRSTTRPTLTPDGPSAGSSRCARCCPPWAVRLLVAALLLPPLLVAVDGFARVRRRREPVAPWLWWLVAAARAVPRRRWPSRWLLGRHRPVPATPPEPVAPGALPLDGAGRSRWSAVALVFVLGWIALRPALLRRAGAARAVARRGRGRRAAASPGARAGRRAVGRQPVRGGAVRPRRAPVAASSSRRSCACARGARVGARRDRRGALRCSSPVDRRPARALAAGLGAGSACCSSPAGTPGRWAGSCGASCSPACVGRAARGAAQPRERDGRPTPAAITVRGPLTYAGPGSLGGTESALRR